MKRFVRGCSWLCLVGLFACGDDSGSPAEQDDNQSEQMMPEVGENMASFDVTGTWEGTAVDEGTNLNVKLRLDNNGGTFGRELAGTLTIEGITTLTFESGVIDPSEGPQRVFQIKAADDEGFAYTLRGNFTEKRADECQLESTNPALGIDGIFLTTNLLRKQ